MHQIRLTEAKITRRLELISGFVYSRRQPLPPFRFHAGEEALVDKTVADQEWPVIVAGSCWGQPRQSFTMRTTFTVPEGWQSPVALFLPLGSTHEFVSPEALAYLDGQAYQGVNAYHQEILLPQEVQDNRPHLLALHGWVGFGEIPVVMGQPEIVTIHQPTRAFVATARVALGVLKELDQQNPIRIALLNALDDAFRLVDLRQPGDERFYASIAPALARLQQKIEQAGPPLDVDIVASGHAHIDVAWLWPLAQTRHKAARSFSTVLRLMEEFPDLHFTQSQPQLYQFIAEDYPDLFAEIRQRVSEGRWEVTGGMWVEPDVNITGAESLVRQLLLGRRYFREHFGEAETPILWLPDTFGFPWSLPQLIKQAGLKYFMTIKITWNQYNRFPYQSFWWQGLDGSKVLTHFITTVDRRGHATYNGDLSPQQIMGTWQNYDQKDLHRELLTAYGYGDGGGGPTREMLENSQRLAHHAGAPRLRQGTAHEFFQNLETQAGDKLPRWNGELYLEYHRGTYTSQARNKRANRKSEFLLHDAEFLAAWAATLSDFKYPHDKLTYVWKLLCLNQFHDILPGSSISSVYDESLSQYAAITSLAEEIKSQALEALAQMLPD
ncbi:MAG: alpha-mannosidase, partial [Chloroflexi bacterium]|nr:alpha-mannosidase [Chloroflexota bacterium]